MSANPETAAPTGRNKPAQGKERSDAALGHASQNTPSPEGAKQGGELPSGWIRLTMGEVGRWFGGGTPSKANPRFWTGGNIPWVSPKDMKFDLITDAQDHITEDAVAQSATNLVEAGSVLIVVRSGILQHTLPVAVASRQVALNQDLKAVKPLENIRSDYLALALKAFERDILHTCTKTGTTVQSLELPVFLRFQIPLPPLPEQRRIVAEIEKQFTRLEAGVAALRRVQANLKRYRAAVLKAACEGRLVPTEAALARSPRSTKNGPAAYETGEALLARILTERRKDWQGRGQYKEPAAPDTANLQLLPEGWTWTNLDAAIVSGPQNGVYLPRELYGRGNAILRIDDYQDGWVRGVDDLNKVEADQATAAKYQLLSGDLVINRVNSLTHLGKCLVVHETHERALFESNMMKAHLAACVSPRYVEFYLRSRDGRARLISGAKWAVNQASINQEDVKRTPLPLPPLAEQTRIVAEVERRLSVVEELESVVTANLLRATRLRQSILQKAFSGKLTAR